MRKNETKPTDGRNARPARIANRTYRAEIERTAVGSPIVRILPLNPRGPSAGHRQIAAFVYGLAAEMELRSESLGATWVISPEAWNARIVLELGHVNESSRADAFVRELLADRDLV